MVAIASLCKCRNTPNETFTFAQEVTDPSLNLAITWVSSING